MKVTGTVPEKTVWTSRVTVEVVVTTVREDAVTVEGTAVMMMTTGVAETVTVVVRGPSVGDLWLISCFKAMARFGWLTRSISLDQSTLLRQSDISS